MTGATMRSPVIQFGSVGFDALPLAQDAQFSPQRFRVYMRVRGEIPAEFVNPIVA